MRQLPFALVLALLLGACARDTGSYPSLAPRAIEKVGFGEPAARPAPAITADPTLDARLAELGKELDRVAAGFAGDSAAAERATTAARGQAAGSEAWLTAQTALARLDDWRAQASSLVTDLEEVATERASTLAPAYPALTALTARAQVEADRQGETIRRLQAGLPSA